MQGLREGAEKGTRDDGGGAARPDILLIGCVKGKLEWASA